MKNPTSKPTWRDAATLQDQRWQDHAPSTIRFRTLFSAPDTPTDSIVCGIAMMAAGDTFALHAHDHAEVYFGLEGEGDVMIDGQAPCSLGEIPTTCSIVDLKGRPRQPRSCHASATIPATAEFRRVAGEAS